MMSKHITNNSFQTRRLGETLSKKVIKKERKKNGAKVIALKGELGGGKTTFLQGFAKGLGIKEKILSPTFAILKKFKIPAFQKSKQGFLYFYHIDCYRIQIAKEILTLGFKKIVSDPKNIIAIEWAERIQEILPNDTIWITFEFYNAKHFKVLKREAFHGSYNKNKRKITLKWPKKKRD